MKYRSKQTEVEAMPWGTDERGYEWSAEDIVEWVNANGGEARYMPETSSNTYRTHMPARIAVRTINGWAYAAPGHYVVMGSETFDPRTDRQVGESGYRSTCRNFYPVDPATFEQRRESAQ